MKKFLVPVLAILCLAACNKDIQQDDPAVDENNVYDYKSELEYTGEVAILNVADANIIELINAFATNIVNGVNSSTNLLIVSSLAPSNDSAIETVYNNNSTIAVIHPNQADVDSFFERHPDWNGYWEDDDMDDAVLFSFTAQGNRHIITAVDDPDCFTFDPKYVPTEEKGLEFPSSQGYSYSPTIVEDGNVDDDPLYTAFESWFSLLDDYDKNGSAANQNINSVAEEQKIDVTAILKTDHYGKSYPFTASEKLRHVAAWCQYDIMSGSGSITTSLDMYKIHAYNGDTVDPSDYYLCYANTRIANGNMYKGKWRNTHFAIVCVFVRMCGFCCEEFNFGFTPLDGKSTQKNKIILGNDRVSIPANGSITPKTTPKETKITDSKSFGLKTEATAGTSAKISKSGPEASKDAKVTIGGNWSWSRSESYSISDAEIVETTSDGNNPSHKIIFNNLPHFDWSEKYGFNEGRSQSFKSTIGAFSSWVWRDANGEDDSTEPSIKVLFTSNAIYKAMSFKTTKADLEEPRFTYGNISDVFTINPIDRDCAASIIVNNNSGKTINHIKVFNAAGQQVYADDNSYVAGKQVELNAFKTKYKYTMSLMIGTDEYKYTQNEYVPLKKGQATTVNVADDFTKK